MPWHRSPQTRDPLHSLLVFEPCFHLLRTTSGATAPFWPSFIPTSFLISALGPFVPLTLSAHAKCPSHLSLPNTHSPAESPV